MAGAIMRQLAFPRKIHQVRSGITPDGTVSLGRTKLASSSEMKPFLTRRRTRSPSIRSTALLARAAAVLAGCDWPTMEEAISFLRSFIPINTYITVITDMGSTKKAKVEIWNTYLILSCHLCGMLHSSESGTGLPSRGSVTK